MLTGGCDPGIMGLTSVCVEELAFSPHSFSKGNFGLVLGHGIWKLLGVDLFVARLFNSVVRHVR